MCSLNVSDQFKYHLNTKKILMLVLKYFLSVFKKIDHCEQQSSSEKVCISFNYFAYIMPT